MTWYGSRPFASAFTALSKRADLHGSQQLAPVRLHRVQCLLRGRGVAWPVRERARLAFVGSRAKAEHDRGVRVRRSTQP